MIRRYHHNNGRPQRKRIIAVTESFHGRTLAPVAASANPMHTEGFLFGDAGFDQVQFGDVEAMADMIGDATAGIVIEPIQGEGGYIVPPPGFHKEMYRIAKQYGILYVADEVQSGMGRTGKMFAMEHFEAEADITAIAKGIASGLPLGANVQFMTLMATKMPYIGRG